MWAEAVLNSEEFARYLGGLFIIGGIAMLLGFMLVDWTEVVGEISAFLGFLAWIVALLSLITLPVIRVLHWVFTGE